DGIRDDLVTGVQTCALPISFDLAIRTRCSIYSYWSSSEFSSALRTSARFFSSNAVTRERIFGDGFNFNTSSGDGSPARNSSTSRSEEHTSELQSPDHLVFRL